MHPVFASAGKTQAIPIWFVHAGNFDSVCKDIGERGRAFVAASGFEAKAGRLMLLPAADGALAGILFGVEAPGETEIDRFRPGQLSGLLPPGNYRFANAPHDTRLAALAFALGAYQFVRYRKAETRNARLVVPDGVDGNDLTRIVEGVALCRDLTNTPSNDMGPSELEAASRALAKQHGAKLQVTSGEALAKNFPLVHAVGAGSARAPRLIDMTWGKAGDPKITLVGKGVLFRYRRARHQTRYRHAQYEEGHGRSRDHAGARLYDHGPWFEGQTTRHNSSGGELDLRFQLPSA